MQHRWTSKLWLKEHRLGMLAKMKNETDLREKRLFVLDSLHYD
jgi:hypothetical protein